MQKELYEILTSKNASKQVLDNLDLVLYLIRELIDTIGFDHKHPHHHLDVFNHTILVIENLNTTDFELNMSALLHDIGKPHSYEEGEVRHFHNHDEYSYNMSKQILERLQVNPDTSKRILYLIRYHDTKIECIDNERELVIKRLKLQYADAMAHHPDKVQKRIDALNQIKKELKL